MKLNQLLNIETKDLDEIGIVNIDFSCDTPLFVDLEKLINSQKFISALAGENPINIFANQIRIFAKLDGGLSEPKKWGLGFSKGNNDGHGPSKIAVNGILNLIDENREFAKNLAVLSPRIEDFGPDSLSDINILVFEEILKSISDSNINYLCKLYPALEKYVVTEIDNHKFINIEKGRRILNVEYLSSLKDIEAFHSRIDGALSEYKQSTNGTQTFNTPAHIQFVQAIVHGKLTDDTVVQLEAIKNFSRIKEIHGTNKYVFNLFRKIKQKKEQISTFSCHEKTLQEIEWSLKEAWEQIAKNADPSEIKEELFQQSFESTMKAMKHAIYREPNAATGNVDFIVNACNKEHIIEMKADKVTHANVIKWGGQLEAYKNSRTFPEKESILAIYTNNQGYDSSDDLFSTEDRHKIYVFGQNIAPSKGLTTRPPKIIDNR